MVAPGMKVANRVEGLGQLMAVGRVTADGTHVVWHAIIAEHGEPNGMRMDKNPKPLLGNEVPCPAEYAHFVTDD